MVTITARDKLSSGKCQLSTNFFEFIGVGVAVGGRKIPKVLARACVNRAMFLKKLPARRPIKPCTQRS